MNNVNNNSSSNTNNGKNNTPLLIIGAVLLVAIIGGWWFYSSQAPTTSNNSVVNKPLKTPTSPTLDIATIINNAPSGAQPPNMLGSPTATVTVEEFADYQCPTCATVHPMMQELVKNYGNRIKFIYRSFPLSTIHQHAYEAAVAAEAAGLQGKFWEMQNQLFPNQKDWANAPDATKIFEGYAEKIGLDMDKYKTDTLGLAAKTRVDADIRRGRAIGINGTPTIYINDAPLDYQRFDLQSMEQIIDGELKKPATSSGQSNSQTTNQTTANTANQANSVGSNSSNSVGSK